MKRVSDEEKRRKFKTLVLDTGVILPGAFNALTAKLIEEKGFGGVYISGGAASASMGFPDIGMFSQTEFVTFASYIVNAIHLPCICDADTGFGDLHQVERTVRAYEQIGLAGLHIEDQLMPKRCGHLKRKVLISTEEMVLKIEKAVASRQDPNFLIIARTDARALEGMSGAIDRAKAYTAAGADLIFPEALQSKEEFEGFALEMDPPLMANMTEFGVSPLIPAQSLIDMGYKIVIFPVSSLRIAMKAVDSFFDHLKTDGTQKGQLEHMQTRKDLYDLLDYSSEE
ncbi:MAG: methylisocitrate lyase [Candidatus Marinamargulisbacteria bacterium]|jgi:methylisocitrate lyase